jgi:hypothetical protein
MLNSLIFAIHMERLNCELVSNPFFFLNSILMDILYSINKNYRIVTKHTMIINIQAHNYYKYDENKKSPDHIALNARLGE